MFGLNLLRAAIGRLTCAFTDFALTLETVNAGVRSQLQLDHQEQKEPAVSLPGTVQGQTAPEPPRNGRSRKTAAAD